VLKLNWGIACALGFTGIAGAWRWFAEPYDVYSIPPGPELQAVQARQVLRVGVRSYPRPTLSGERLVAEPNEIDSALAYALGRYLNVHVQLFDLPDHDPQDALTNHRVDVLIAGNLSIPSIHDQSQALDAPPVDYRDGALLALRNEPAFSLANLEGIDICVEQGSPWSVHLGRLGAAQRIFTSSTRAAAAFMAGDCRLLAGERTMLEKLQTQPEWRFYRILEWHLKASGDTRVYLAKSDQQSMAFLHAALLEWQQTGGQAQAWDLYISNVIIESLKLWQGLVCH
jgi:polar amino acid transport system substrate-binding protein